MRLYVVCLLLVGTALAGCSEESSPPVEEEEDLGLDEPLQATATTGVIRGVVIDVAIVPVEGANVTIQGRGQTTTTNANGAFGFSDLEPGTYFLQASKPGFNSTQVTATVVAGEDKPDVVKIQILANPGSAPYWVPTYYAGFLACGFAIVATSIGCTITAQLATLTESTSIWLHVFDSERIMYTQGELVWEHNQPAGGMLIWEITARNNDPLGYRETAASPALAYLSPEIIEANNRDIKTEGVTYRFFGGPHPLCTGVFFGCGITIDQPAEAFIHDFYNHLPPEGWRYTSQGDPPRL